MPSFGSFDLRIHTNCNLEKNQNFSELGNSYFLPDNIEEDSKEAEELLTGSGEFYVDEIEVF